jgi:hypothetical protein
MHSKESSWDADEIIDTRKLQMFSLCQMMKRLHYEFVPCLSAPSRFESKHYSNKGREFVSFGSAIKLYNGDSVKCVFGRPPERLTIWSFNDYDVAQAKAARIVRSVKLQQCKATNTILVQDHRVQFILHSYKDLFLNNKYLEV